MKIRITRATSEQAPLVQDIYEHSPGYFRNVDHSEVLPGFAERDMTDSPPKEKQTDSYEKIFCIFWSENTPVGVIDLHKDHPQKDSIYLGLLLIDERHQKQGIGRLCYVTAEDFIRSNLSCSKILLGVAETNNVEPFWTKMGFSRNGKTYVWNGANHKNNVFEMEKILT